MTIEIRKASRKKAKLRLGISAPSGAGKTLGSLLVAYGIAKDWSKIGLIDTEEGSGELYVGVHKHGVTIGDYLYARISRDFSPVHYISHVKAMENAGAEVIIIDSLTHAWSGTEGLLDKQGRIAAKSGNSYTAWRDVTPQHNALVNAMLQSQAHVIATMRSKVEYAMQKGNDDKFKIVKMGMAPIQREGMEYEFTVFFDIASDSIASASKDRTDLFSTVNAAGTLDKRAFLITPGIGEELLSWLHKGGNPEIPQEQIVLRDIEAKLAEVTLDPAVAEDDFLLKNRLTLNTLPIEKLEKIKQYLNTKQ